LSPFYIYFLAAGLALTRSFTAVRLLQILLGTMSVGFIFLMAREWFGERAAWLAAGLAALTGLFTFYEVLILQAAVDPVLTSAALLALTLALRATPRHAAAWMLASGALFGVASLNRPNMTLAVGGILVVMLAMRRWRHAALLAGGLAVGLAPSLVRNVVVSHQWTFVSSHGGLNFYIGNGETATGFYHQIPGITPNIGGQARDAQRVAEKATGQILTEAEVSNYFFTLATKWMTSHPGSAIALLARKFGYTLHAQHIALPYSYPFYAYDAGTLLRFFIVGPWLLVPLGLAGLAFAAPKGPRWREYLIWASFVPCYAAAVALFFVAERYRLPLLVPLSIGAGAAIDQVWRAISRREWRTIAVPAGAAALVAIGVNWPLRLSDGRWDEGLRMAERLVIIGRYDEAEQWVAKLEPGAPRHGVLDFTVGRQLMFANQAASAVAHLARANELDPGQPNVEYSLGQALQKAGRNAEAIPHLRRGLDAGADVPLGGYDLAVALEATGDLAGAVDVIRRIQPGPDDTVEAWLRLGRLAAEVKAPDLAESFFRHAVQMQPDSASAHQQLGLDLLVLGRFEDAHAELTASARLQPRDADTLAHLAYCEVKLNRLDDARGHVRAALAIDAAHPLARQLEAALSRASQP
jgi:tetratricopeptide (TPR) repeat protein